MSTASCSFEIQPPVTEPNPAHTHPDPEVYARMAAVARGGMSRRFALCRYKQDGPADQSNVFCEFYGWQYRDGVTITDHRGQPVGWYTTIDTAHHHLNERRPFPLWLVWLEPERSFTTAQQGTAATEAAQLEPGPFIAGVGFTASGLEDARLHAIRLVEAAETFLPDVQRHACIVGSGKHGVHSLFCSQVGCVKPSQHASDHDIPSRQVPGHQPPKVDPDDLDIPDDQREVIDEARQRQQSEGQHDLDET